MFNENYWKKSKYLRILYKLLLQSVFQDKIYLCVHLHVGKMSTSV